MGERYCEQVVPTEEFPSQASEPCDIVARHYLDDMWLCAKHYDRHVKRNEIRALARELVKDPEWRKQHKL